MPESAAELCVRSPVKGEGSGERGAGEQPREVGGLREAEGVYDCSGALVVIAIAAPRGCGGAHAF